MWQITLTEAGTTGRFLLPEGADTASLKLLAAGEDGSWKEIPFTRDGSYLVFALSGQEMTLALVQIPRNYTPVYAAAACVLLIAAAIPLLRRKKNSRPIKEAEEF